MQKYVLIAFVLLAITAVIVAVLSSAGESAHEDGETNQQADIPTP